MLRGRSRHLLRDRLLGFLRCHCDLVIRRGRYAVGRRVQRRPAERALGRSDRTLALAHLAQAAGVEEVATPQPLDPAGPQPAEAYAAYVAGRGGLAHLELGGVLEVLVELARDAVNVSPLGNLISLSI